VLPRFLPRLGTIVAPVEENQKSGDANSDEYRDHRDPTDLRSTQAHDAASA
jgi:hypothetical protein